ncbi:MAG: NAD(P)/FAD-dependent oxidoreductase [Asgard group archaeon]|nr:NAD(P)/FAD-dependent oxidoreductase [Asgard group archaeon]
MPTIPNDKVSLIVIGGGISGLSAALTWAHTHDLSKEPVLLVEKEPKTGGFVTSYERSGFLFDTCQMIPNISEILNFLDVNIEMKKFMGYYSRVFIVDTKIDKVKKIELPSGFTTFKNKLMTNYPSNAKEIERFLDHSRAMYDELFKLKMEPKFVDILKLLITCPKIVKNSKKTFAEYFKQFNITEPDVIEIFEVFAAFSALPGEQAAALITVSAMNSLLDGAFRPTKGFIEFPKKIEERYLSLGGKLLLKTKVDKILVEDGVVKGVRLDTGKTIYSDYVITTIDPKVAMKELVGIDLIQQSDEKYAQKVEDVKMSCSSLNISLGLDDKLDLAALGMDCGYNVITTGGDTFNKLYLAFEKGDSAFSDDLFHFGVICPSLTTGGKPNLTIRVVPMAMGQWAELRVNNPEKYKQEKEKWADFVIDKIEKYLIPNLRKHIVAKDISTPATYARYSGSPTGSIYDMAPYTNNFGRTRLKMRTPIKGLFQPRFVHGVFGSLLSGMQVNDMILNGKIMNGYARLSKNNEE